MLTPDDEKLITRAILSAMAKWSFYCFATGVVLWLIWVIVSHSLPE